jgi:hypothetical protein
LNTKVPDPRPFPLRELVAALDDYLIQMHRSLGMGERVLDTVYYFPTPTLDRLIASAATPLES